MPTFDLNKINIVLCDTSNSGNIGSAARAMKTMGIFNLTLVAPVVAIDDYCYALSTHAKDILDNVKIVSTLQEALKGTTLAYAMTSRKREFNYSLTTAAECVPEILNTIHNNENIAIVFGSEKNGLTIAQVELCNRLVTIPGNPQYFSLNLSQAVQIMVYEIYKQANGSVKYLKDSTSKSSFEDNQGILNHINSILQHNNYYFNKNEDLVLRNLQHILYKANLSKAEVRLIRGMLNLNTKCS